jgi:deltex-like protein
MSSIIQVEKDRYNILTLEQCIEFKKNNINPLTKRLITNKKRIEYITKKCDELKKNTSRAKQSTSSSSGPGAKTKASTKAKLTEIEKFLQGSITSMIILYENVPLPDNPNFEKYFKELTKYEIVVDTTRSSSSKECPICLGNFKEKESSNPRIALGKCKKHSFHLECIKKCYKTHEKSLTCPICKEIYGELHGNQPNGSMTIKHYNYNILSNTKAIQIDYYTPAGVNFLNIDTESLVNYKTDTRTAFLPLNDEGIQILKLFIKAYKRGLILTIGTSITRNEQNVVVWNGIHHKTSLVRKSVYGYPDVGYFTRVTDELKFKGIE